MASFFALSNPCVNPTGSVYGDARWCRKYERVAWTKDVEFDVRLCSLESQHARILGRKGPLAVKRLQDIGQDFWWTWQGDLIVRATVADRMIWSGLTGFSKAPISIGGYETDDVVELLVGSRIEFDLDREGMVWTDRCPDCGVLLEPRATKGLKVDESSWDGSNFVKSVDLPFAIFVDEVAASWIMDNRMVPCILTPEDRYIID